MTGPATGGLRRAVVPAGVVAVIASALAVTAIVLRPADPAVLAVSLAVLLVLLSAVLVVPVGRRWRREAARTATRLRNLERRGRGVVERMDRLEGLGGRTGDRPDGASGPPSASATDLTRLAAALDGIREEVDRTGRAVRTLEGRLTRSDEDRTELAVLLAGTRGRLDLLAAGTDDLIDGARRMQAALDHDHERSERVRRDLRILRERVPAGRLERMTVASDGLREQVLDLARATVTTSGLLDPPVTAVLPPALARDLATRELARGRILWSRALVDEVTTLEGMSVTTLRAVYRAFRSAGYWDTAAAVATVIGRTTGRDRDLRAAEKTAQELAVFGTPDRPEQDLPAIDAYEPSGPILHVVGRVLPHTQTGYTLRTHYTAQAQVRAGLRVAVVGQPGITETPVDSAQRYVHQGVEYHLLPGAARQDSLMDDWVAAGTRALADLVGELRPSVLHAHSDFVNVLLARAVGERYGIPVVYESRGFWEESWLSRTVAAQGWGEDADDLFAVSGLPAAYTLRRRAEEVARARVDHVFTLAEVMRDHILASPDGPEGRDLAVDPRRVSLVPNAVDADAFPVLPPDEDLRRSLGIAPDEVIVGYISSMVQYEGIDTLIDAVAQVTADPPCPVRLLLVGDGDHLPALRAHAERIGLEDVVFTGRVPHEEVLRYYGLIDVFVVPRRPAVVADLVTPLKPFEAFATGRAVVLSDVGALLEIARQSEAVETFRAGDAEDLAAVLTGLVGDEGRRAELSARAAAWVRSHRAWDANVLEYHRVYDRLGYRGPVGDGLLDEARLRDAGTDLRDVLEAARRLEDPPVRGVVAGAPAGPTVEEILRDGWAVEGSDPVPVVPAPDWAGLDSGHHDLAVALHGWQFLEPLLAEDGRTGGRDLLPIVLDVVEDWLRIHLPDAAPEGTVAWDAAVVAARAPVLLAVLVRAARRSDLRSRVPLLVEGLRHHAAVLPREGVSPIVAGEHPDVTVARRHLARFGRGLPGIEDAGDIAP